MFCEDPRNGFGLGEWGKRWAIAGLCLLPLVLMGCTDASQAAGDQGQMESGQMEQVTQPIVTQPIVNTPSLNTPSNTGSEPGANQMPEPSADGPGSPLGLGDLAQMLPVGAEVVLGGETIALEVTRTVEEQAKGLMYRERLPGDRGMLFRFSPARPVQFWMKNVVIDLDMVFVYRGKIVGIAADVPPCTTTPCPTYGPGAGTAVSEVIELAGGRAAELGLAIGDAVEIAPVVP